MIKTTVAELFEKNTTLIEVEVKGWVKSFRANRFIALNDGSTIKNMQCVVKYYLLERIFSWDEKNINLGILKNLHYWTLNLQDHFLSHMTNNQKSSLKFLIYNCLIYQMLK